MTRYTLLLAAGSLLFAACNKEASSSADLITGFALGQGTTATASATAEGTGQVQFGVGRPSSAAPPSPSAPGTLAAQEVSGSPFPFGRGSWSATELPESAIVTVADGSGKTILEDQVIPVECTVYSVPRPGYPNVVSRSCATASITLPVGTYTLQRFAVSVRQLQMEPNQTKAYATPVAGSQLAHLVSQPLPLPFTVEATTVGGAPGIGSLEVIEAQGNPEDFGYPSLPIARVDTFSFHLVTMNGASRLGPTVAAADVLVQGFSDPTDTSQFHTEFEGRIDGATRITLSSNYIYHRITGYLTDGSGAYNISPDLTRESLAQYVVTPYVLTINGIAHTY